MEQAHGASVRTQAGNGNGTSSIEFRSIRAMLNTSQAITELRHLLGEDSISTDDEDLHRHGYSEWSSINIEQLPVAVAYPKSTDEVSEIAKTCYKHKIPMSTYQRLGRRHRLNFSSSLFWWLESGGKFLSTIRRHEYRLYFHGSNCSIARRRVRYH